MASHDGGQKPGDVISLVLTADNHLGYSAFGQQPRKREVLQQRLRQAFQQATDFALQQKVDLFIQAGDLFDTAVPQERDRSFVAERLSELKRAGIQTFALGGLHDIPAVGHARRGGSDSSPLLSYERLGALHYFSPVANQKLEPVLLNLHGVQVGISGLSVFTEQDVDPLTGVQMRDGIDRASFSLLVLHAPIDGLTTGSSLFEARAQVSRQSLTELPAFRYVLAGYHHKYSRLTFGQTEVVVAGTTQHIDFNTPDEVPGFVYLGLAADGIRWCKHIPVESFSLQSLLIPTSELWSAEAELQQNVDPTALILERLRPLCGPDMLLLLRLEGELSRSQYHQLDLNQIRRYGEEHCFALAIDDSALVLLSDLDMPSPEAGERFSPREELIALADEWIADAFDEHEQKAWRVTKEELLLALDDLKGRR
ncbi:MAG TPA: metallophosphoesterase [Ktedonobacteraceae bacterium]